MGTIPGDAGLKSTLAEARRWQREVSQTAVGSNFSEQRCGNPLALATARPRGVGTLLHDEKCFEERRGRRRGRVDTTRPLLYSEEELFHSVSDDVRDWRLRRSDGIWRRRPGTFEHVEAGAFHQVGRSSRWLQIGRPSLSATRSLAYARSSRA